MTKDDIKKYLIENGASEVLIQMPAVMERIYSYFEATPESIYSGYTGTISSMSGLLPRQFGRMLIVKPDGSITIKNGVDIRRFEERPNGEAVYFNDDQGIMGIDEAGEYQIDRYGMDKSFLGKHGGNVTRTEVGTIKSKDQEYQDDGSPIINVGYYVESRDKSDEDFRKNWLVNKNEIVENYHNSRKWFEDREPHIKDRFKRMQDDEIIISGLVEDRADRIKIPSPNDVFEDNASQELKKKDETIELLQKRDTENGETIVRLRNSNEEKDRRIEDLQQQNEEKDAQIMELQRGTAERDERIADLQTRNSSLQERNKKLQEMLTTSLNKLQQIKSSMFGRFFFTKEERKIRKLPEEIDPNQER